MIPPNLYSMLVGLIGALLGVAVTWGRSGETIRQLKDSVEKLTAKIELLAALEKADALHAQETAHLRAEVARLEGRVGRLEEHAFAPGSRPRPVGS